MDGPVRVAHVIGALNYGGVETCALNLLMNLPRPLIESRVYFIGESLTGRRIEFEEAACDFQHVPYVSPHRLRFMKRLAKALREDRIDTVLCYSFGNHAWVSMAAWLARVRRSYVCVGGSPVRSPMTLLKCVVLAHIARPFCAGEIAPSYQVRDELTNGLWLPARRVHVVENFCDVFEIARRAAGSRAFRRGKETPSILMTARMDDAKDHDTAIKAIAMLVRSGRSLKLRFAGDGPRRARLESLCKNEGLAGEVEFLGDRADVAELLGLSDIAVLATHTEGFGLAIAEAMSASKPVIATSLPVTREVLDDGRCGLLVRPRDPGTLAAAIELLLADRALRERLVSSAFEKAAKRYNIDRAIEEYTTLLTGGVQAPGATNMQLSLSRGAGK